MTDPKPLRPIASCKECPYYDCDSDENIFCVLFYLPKPTPVTCFDADFRDNLRRRVLRFEEGGK